MDVQTKAESPFRVMVDKEGDHYKVLLLVSGKRLASMGYKTAYHFGKALMYVAGLVEHLELPDRIIGDQAILMASGMPIGLTDNIDLRKEAQKTAETDRDIRRYIGTSKGISEQETMGVPKIKLGPPPEDKGDEEDG